MKNNPVFLVIDLFCGAGGTSFGFKSALLNARQLAKVIACVNHDSYAIKSHRLNHKEAKHFKEDIRKLDVKRLIEIVNYWKQQYPDAYVILWASLECTNFSWAKGGKPRNADSRTLANHLTRYIDALRPDYIMIENVVEFMAWGPLDENGKPVSNKNGQYWLQWRQGIKDQFGYRDAWQEVNSANLGAFTSRNRLFGIFTKPGLPITFPEATHCKKPSSTNLFDSLLPWQPVSQVLNFANKGTSIFTRKKPLSEKTLARIYKGLLKYASGKQQRKVNQFISLYYTNGSNYSLNEPLPTITTKDRAALISLEWYNPNTPTFLINPAWGGNTGHMIDPCCVIIARQDKAPLYVVQSTAGTSPAFSKKDSPLTAKIKSFMAEHNIADISMRMLSVPELLKIQGFPSDYQLTGTLTAQKKFIGNSVVPLVVKAWTEALARQLIDRYTVKAA